MTFTEFNLDPKILKAIADCGYEAPTPIQAKAIPRAMAGADLLATAQTGTGKTAAFVLPALQRLSVPPITKARGPRVLVLTPTRELANQVTEATRTYGKYLRVKTGVILGGMPYREQLRLLSGPVDLIVATPGRLIDHLDQRRINLSSLEILVLDEADRMLDMGFSEDVAKIAAAAPASRQTLLFTATPVDATMSRLAGQLLKNHELIEIVGKKTTLENIEQRLHVADDFGHKNRILQHLIADKEITRAIIFSATKRDADSLASELKSQGHSAAALHGDMNQGARNRTIADMRRGKIRLLVATDVASRGLDVSGISHIINFDLPKFPEDYVHRIGRTGRAGASGIAISFVSYHDLDALHRIEYFIGQILPEQEIPGLEPSRMLRRPAARKTTRTGAGRGRGGYGQRSSGQSKGGYSAGRGRNDKWKSPRAPRDSGASYRDSKPARAARSGF